MWQRCRGGGVHHGLVSAWLQRKNSQISWSRAGSKFARVASEAADPRAPGAAARFSIQSRDHEGFTKGYSTVSSSISRDRTPESSTSQLVLDDPAPASAVCESTRRW